MTLRKDLCLALGILLGDWLLMPIFDPNKTALDGLRVGVVAAILMLLMTAGIKLWQSFRR